MKYLVILLSSIIISSCSFKIATSEDLTQVNNRTTLNEAKAMFEDIYEEESIITKKIGDTYYTVLVVQKVTVTEKEKYTTTTSQPAIGTDSHGNPTTRTEFRDETREKYNNTFTNFYLVFKGQDYVFSGFGYEAKISPKSDLLNSLIGFDLREEVE